MPIHPIVWPRAMTYSINQNLDFAVEHVREGLGLWQAVADVSFQERPPGAPAELLFVRLDELQSTFGAAPGHAALSVVITDTLPQGEVGRVAYVGLDRGTIPSFDPVRVAAHEIGHAFGFVDDPAADPGRTLYSYVASTDRRLGGRDIEELQQRLGPSPRHDLIRHGDGPGRVTGGGGDDSILGAGGDDLIYGNQGTDALSGGTGDDVLYGGQSVDVLLGGSGSDRLYGNLGDDALEGGPGSDRLFGGRGDDLLQGGEGDDRLAGNLGRDTMVGGPGADCFVIGDGDHVLDFRPEEGDRLSGWTPQIAVTGVSPQEAGLWLA